MSFFNLKFKTSPPLWSKVLNVLKLLNLVHVNCLYRPFFPNSTTNQRQELQMEIYQEVQAERYKSANNK